jgi:pyrroloquinoline quinone biosynthesis protein E
MAVADWNDRVFRLARGVRIRRQSSPEALRALLAPEKFYPLDLSEAAILEFCTGEVPFNVFVPILGRAFEQPVDDDFTGSIADYLEDLIRQRLVVSEESAQPFTGDLSCHLAALDQAIQEYAAAPAAADDFPIPRLLLAELTHRCPLRCPYCSNPTALVQPDKELATDEWIRAFGEASQLGVLHVGISGGEPLARKDLPELIAGARATGLYTNLITSAIGLTPEKAEELKKAGLDSVQISFQSDEELQADEIAGYPGHALKLAAARMIAKMGFPLTFNVVLHRRNIDRLESIINLAGSLGAQQLELANVQFYGWAMQNRAELLPTRAQVETAFATAQAAHERWRDTMDVIYVPPDYFGTSPKPCMQGWGRQYITVNPGGDVLPCPTASGIPGLRFDNIRDGSLADIWRNSEAFNRFRGTQWMPEPCRSCDLRFIDYGGCRCQAALIAGDASFTDPACELSPYRNKLTEILDRQPTGAHSLPPQYVYRALRLPSLIPHVVTPCAD